MVKQSKTTCATDKAADKESQSDTNAKSPGTSEKRSLRSSSANEASAKGENPTKMKSRSDCFFIFKEKQDQKGCF